MSGPQPGTPTPWEVLPGEGDKDYVRIRGTRLGGRYKVANVLFVRASTLSVAIQEQAEAEANAAAIVHRMNNWDALVDALEAADNAINEMFRYFYGGETRGSYDGKPERDQLRRAGYTARAVLAKARGEA